MANKQIIMGKVRQVLRMYTQGKSKLLISEQLGISRNTVKKYINQFTEHKITFEELNELTDVDLEDLFGHKESEEPNDRYKQLLSFFPKVSKEIKRNGVTKQIMWEEYLKLYPNGYRHSQFFYYYDLWSGKVNSTMHIEHKAGDKMYIDYAGEKLHIVNKITGEIKEVEVFVAILGASQLTYVEACLTQQKEDFIACCENALYYFGGVPQAIVPDNLKSAVTKSDKYEPTLNETFSDFAEHYGTTILPARAYRPKDKSLVEGAVKIIYTRIYASIRDKTFFSLDEINQEILIELNKHNNTPLQGRNYSRREQFEEIERNTLQPLNKYHYELKKQSIVTVLKNGHVCLGEDKHYYSVPYRYIGKKVKILYSQNQIEIYLQYERIATHRRNRTQHLYSTIEDHLASKHKFLTEWTPEKFIYLAEQIDIDVKTFIEKILEKKQHPEQAYKSCVGVLSLTKKVGEPRLINACRRAIEFGAYNYKMIKAILEKGLDTEPSIDKTITEIPLHDNIRGENYYK